MDHLQCPEVEPGCRYRCQLVPDHDGEHVLVMAAPLPRGHRTLRLRRWIADTPAVDTGPNSIGDLVPAGSVRWAIGCPVHEDMR